MLGATMQLVRNEIRFMSKNRYQKHCDGLVDCDPRPTRSIHRNQKTRSRMGAGTTGVIGNCPHGNFPRLYAPVTKIHTPSSILIFMLNIKTKLKYI
jgi:hypothetical protein